MRDQPLWDRLAAYDFPMSDGRSLNVQIKAVTGLSDAQIALLVQDYRRFLYLVATGGQVLAPSSVIDRVWHQHLMDTKAYFDSFCPQVLGKPLHHIPGRPAPVADAAYLDTLAQYQAEFGEAPLPEIWPLPETLRARRDADQSALGLAVAAVGLGFVSLWLTLIAGLAAIAVLITKPGPAPWQFVGAGDGGSGCGAGWSGDGGGDGGGGDGGSCGGGGD